MTRRNVRQVGVQVHLLFISGTDGGEWSTSRPGHFNPGKERRDSLNNRFGRSQSRYRCFIKRKICSVATQIEIGRHQKKNEAILFKISMFVTVHQDMTLTAANIIASVMIWVWSIGEMILTEQNQTKLGENPVSASLCISQISHGTTRNWTRDSAVRGLWMNHGTARVCYLITISVHKPYEHEQEFRS